MAALTTQPASRALKTEPALGQGGATEHGVSLLGNYDWNLEGAQLGGHALNLLQAFAFEVLSLRLRISGLEFWFEGLGFRE